MILRLTEILRRGQNLSPDRTHPDLIRPAPDCLNLGECDVSKYVSFAADKDNIIPICDDEYFEDDIVGLLGEKAKVREAGSYCR